MKVLPLISFLLLTACAPRNEHYTYLIAPQVSDEQIAELRTRDERVRVFTSADGSQRWLTSPTPVDQLGARVGALRNAPIDATASGEVFIGLIEGVVNGLRR